jgi:hypothetical protein
MSFGDMLEDTEYHIYLTLGSIHPNHHDVIHDDLIRQIEVRTLKRPVEPVFDVNFEHVLSDITLFLVFSLLVLN